MHKDTLNVLFVGPQRSGSSFLYSMFHQYDTVRLPHEVKELFFFDKKFSKGYKWYWSFFRKNGGNITMDFAPTAFTSSLAIQRVKEHNPHIKIVIVFRDPIVKAYSLFKHHFSKGRVGSDVKRALLDYPEISNSANYRKYLMLWQQEFPNDQIFLLRFDDLLSYSSSGLRRLHEFLEIEQQTDLEDSLDKNSSAFPRSRSAAKLADTGAKLLRKVGLHSVVNALKKAGFKRVFTGGAIHVSEDEFRSVFMDNIDFKLADFSEVQRQLEDEH